MLSSEDKQTRNLERKDDAPKSSLSKIKLDLLIRLDLNVLIRKKNLVLLELHVTAY